MDWSELLGILYGDGCICSKDYEIRITLGIDDYEYAMVIASYLQSIGLKPHLRMCGSNEIWIRVWSKSFWLKVSQWLSSDKTIKVPPSEMKSFIRGLFDTDGSVHIDKGKYPVISIRNTNLQLLESIKNYLNEIGIKAYVYGPEITPYGSKVWKLRAYGLKNCEKWVKLIGSSNPRKLKILLTALQPGETVRGESRGSEPD